MADLSSINEQLKPEAEMVGGDTYVEASEFIRPLEEGTYTFVQGKVLDADFSATKPNPAKGNPGGKLQVALNHVVTGGEHDGAKITFDRVNTSTFDRSGVRACSFIDHLRAIGNRSQFNLSDFTALANAMQEGEGKRFKGVVRWEFYCQGCSETAYKGAGKNPASKMPNGKANHVAKCPTCGLDIGANARIDRRLPLSAEAQAGANGQSSTPISM